MATSELRTIVPPAFARHEDAQPGSPLWHLHKLLGELRKRSRSAALPALQGVLRNARPSLKLLESYYLGEYQLPWVSQLATQRYAVAFRDMMASVQDNWMALVVDSVEERLHVEGFRFAQGAAADLETWEMWQANNLDAESELLHTTALITGTAYTMVWYGSTFGAPPTVTIEHPLDVICGYRTKSSREPFVALKQYTDEWTGELRASLYYADQVLTFARRDGKWVEAGQMANPLGEVPVVEYSSRPFQGFRSTTSRGGRSEIADVLATQDQINKLVCDMLVAAEFGAFRARWATGLELPPGKTDADGWEMSIARLVRNPSPEGKFGTFDSTDLGQYIKAVENRVQSLASRTRTPPHYLLGNSGSFPSGESLRAAETGLTAKVGSRQRHLEEGHERTARLMWRVRGDDERANAVTAETIWRDSESRSESEHVDALGKMRKLLDVPPQALWQRAGFSPTEIAQFRTMLAEWAIFATENGIPDPAASGDAGG